MERTRFEAVAGRWLLSERRSFATSAAYRRVIHNHLLPTFGAMLVPDIRPGQIERFLVEHPGERAHVQLIRSVFRQILEYARRLELIETNPMPQVRLRRSGVRRQEKVLTAEEHQRLLEQAAELPDPSRGAIELLALTGLRVGELVALRLEDFDGTETITVQRTFDRARGAINPTPKSGESRRVHLSPRARDTWGRLADRARHLKVLWLLGYAYPYVRHMRPELVRAELAKLTRKVTPHGLRHTYCSLLVAAGVPIQYVQRQAGHASIAITVDRYGHHARLRDPSPLHAIDGALVSKCKAEVQSPSGAAGGEEPMKLHGASEDTPPPAPSPEREDLHG